jgi:phosphoadenosine phosphosulfate reductase
VITALRSGAELAAVADRAAVELADASAQDILRWAADEFGKGLAVTASMQDTVLVHLASKALPGIDVLFLETGYHFIETIGTADAVEAVYDVSLKRLLPLQTVQQQDAQYGKDLFATDPDLCCDLRKVAP